VVIARLMRLYGTGLRDALHSDHEAVAKMGRLALRCYAKRQNIGESRGMVWVGPPMRPEAESRRKMVMEAES